MSDKDLLNKFRYILNFYSRITFVYNLVYNFLIVFLFQSNLEIETLSKN
ncbi:MAG: hypothetical protein UV02_C0050G0002 [Candidatus Kuenenbacteria bacterium GW2011_GWA2_42_15]|uniref:Uncharacterized protein n=1 Tax=Candidatus Kuenenbacteria bacterium GW2011_GWA2_42_15 TaxID=1618677 RepID=A0A0G0YTM0_9BACT|nr:MAG: hypothetical protein UV02_C0050G0002 [Candidatus Kuenenbacteria bacterium GW2011_GWA2_42_15]